MKQFKKFAAVLLILTLLLSACSGGDTSWAFKSGQTQASSGLYILYQISAFSEAETIIAEAMESGYTGMTASELLKQTVEDKPASDWINARADELVREHIVVQEKFTSLGLSLNDSELASVESSLGAVKSSAGDFYEKNGVSEVTLREYYTGYARMNRLFFTIYGEGGEFEVSQDELRKYFSENYALIDALLMFKPYSVPEGETKTIEQLTDDQRASAEEYLSRLKAGEEIEQLSYEWQLAQASEDQKADVTKPEKGQLGMVVSESARSSYGDALTDAAIKAKIGDSEMVEDEDFFVVLKKNDILQDPEEFESYKTTVLYELKGDEYESKIAEWAASAQIEVNSATINRYKPEKIKLD